jgi:predicted  nucleic acid-binding Zn-ribbon protein
MDRSLFELQEADNAIARIKRERGKLDDGGSLRAERDTLAAARDAGAQKLKELNAKRSHEEDELAATEEKIKRSQSRLMTATGAHEVTALERDIKGLNARRGEFDETLLVLMDEIDAAAGELKEQEAQLQSKESETAEAEALFKRETARLEQELTAALAERQRIADSIAEPIRKKYDDAAKRHHGIAIAHIDKGNCSACGMALTLHNLREAKGQEWPECDNCNRYLFIE